MSWRPIVILLPILASLVIPADGQQARVIRPTQSTSDLILMRSNAWQERGGMSESALRLAHAAYVAGFWDAVALAEVSVNQKSPAFFLLSSELEGMTLEQLIDTIDKFYQDHPQWRDIGPAVVISTVVPRLRRGLPPLAPQKQ